MLNRLTSALSLSSTPAATPPSSKPSSTSASPKRPPTHLDHLEKYEKLAHQLDDAGVPVSFEDCRTCEDPCDPSAGITTGFPRGFEQDWDLDLAGSAKPNAQRTVVISTGRSDWEHDHTVCTGDCGKRVVSDKLILPSDGRDDTGLPLGQDVGEAL